MVVVKVVMGKTNREYDKESKRSMKQSKHKQTKYPFNPQLFSKSVSHEILHFSSFKFQFNQFSKPEFHRMNPIISPLSTLSPSFLLFVKSQVPISTTFSMDSPFFKAHSIKSKEQVFYPHSSSLFHFFFFFSPLSVFPSHAVFSSALAAFCVQVYNFSRSLHFEFHIAPCCALHRAENQAIHRKKTF